MQGERSAPRTTVESPEGVADRNQAVAELMERYYRAVVSYFYRRGFDVEESRDLAQETFSGMLRAIERYRGEGSLEAFLFSIANNIYHNRLRDKMALKRQPGPTSMVELAEAGAEVATQEDDQLARLLAQERVEVLERAMQELPPQSRHCLILLLHEGLRYREIAGLLEISIGTVKSHIHNARRLLARQLDDRFGSP